MGRKRNYTPESVPDKYVEGSRDPGARRAEVAARSKKPSTEPFKTDTDPKTGKPYKTKESKHTKAYRKAYGEDATGSVAKVSKATGISKSILKKVYDRGMTAWKTGHRPGATAQQWAMARVYSFVTGGKTWSTADKDLAEKAKAKGFSPKRKSNSIATLKAKLLR